MAVMPSGMMRSVPPLIAGGASVRRVRHADLGRRRRAEAAGRAGGGEADAADHAEPPPQRPPVPCPSVTGPPVADRFASARRLGRTAHGEGAGAEDEERASEQSGHKEPPCVHHETNDYRATGVPRMIGQTRPIPGEFSVHRCRIPDLPDRNVRSWSFCFTETDGPTENRSPSGGARDGLCATRRPC